MPDEKTNQVNPTSRRPLSKKRVLQVAMKMADQHGVASLSMRKLADRLKVKAMSLYNHVRNKEEILDGLVDLVMEKIEFPHDKADWKSAMRRRAKSAFEVFVKHPWAASLTESQSSPSPVRMKHSDAVIGCLRAGGFSVELSYKSFLILDSYIYGFALQVANWDCKPNGEDIEVLKKQTSKEAYPNMMEVIEYMSVSGNLPSEDTMFLAEFEFGLDMILDGLERLGGQP